MRPVVCRLVPEHEWSDRESDSDSVGEQESGNFRLYYLPVSREAMLANFSAYVDQFHERMAAATTTVDKVGAIAWFHQIMQRIEPSKDGNQRTAILFLNKHLIEYGLYPALLGWPHGADVFEYDRWRRDVFIGMEWWRLYCERMAPELATTLTQFEAPAWEDAEAGEGDEEEGGE